MTRVLTPMCGPLAEQLAGRAGNSMVGKPPTWLSTSVGKSGTLVDGCTMANSIRSFRNQGPRPPRVESGTRKDPRQPGLRRRSNSDITLQTFLKRGEIEPRTSHQGRSTSGPAGYRDGAPFSFTATTNRGGARIGTKPRYPYADRAAAMVRVRTCPLQRTVRTISCT